MVKWSLNEAARGGGSQDQSSLMSLYSPSVFSFYFHVSFVLDEGGTSGG